MLDLTQVPGNYNQNPVNSFLQQLLMQRKQEGQTGAVQNQMPGMQMATPAGQQQGQPNHMDGLQSISKLLGYDPSTIFGYDMSGMSNKAAPQGPTPTGDPMQQPSMNMMDAMGKQSILGLIAKMFI